MSTEYLQKLSFHFYLHQQHLFVWNMFMYPCQLVTLYWSQYVYYAGGVWCARVEPWSGWSQLPAWSGLNVAKLYSLKPRTNTDKQTYRSLQEHPVTANLDLKGVVMEYWAILNMCTIIGWYCSRIVHKQNNILQKKKL